MSQQLDIFDFIETPQGRYAREEQERYNNIVNYLKTTNDIDLNIIFYGNIYNNTVFNDFIETAHLIKNTKTYHFANLTKDIYIYSYYDRGYYYRCYQVKDRILVENIHAKQFNEDVYFPAMCLKMLNINGMPIHFSNRTDFIMNDLGFDKIGVIRSDLFKRRDFSTLKVRFQDLINYLKE